MTFLSLEENKNAQARIRGGGGGRQQQNSVLRSQLVKVPLHISGDLSSILITQVMIQELIPQNVL